MKAIIIGAGQTGRGLIAPILKQNGYEIVFIDKNEDLITRLNKSNKYLINYFGNLKPTIEITDFKAYMIDSVDALNSIKDADVVTTSVFANQIESLIPFLAKGISNRVKKKKLNIIAIENGVDVKKPLISAQLDANISEGIIFCTSINERESLNITSEANIEVPINENYLPEDFRVIGMPKIRDFNELVQRKIYTYNFISAIISYFGDYKNYKNYADAANDRIIKEFIYNVLPNINYIISKHFSVTISEQEEFSRKAVIKFENRNIVDSIERNAQQASRKLGVNERLIIPLKLAIKYQVNTLPYIVVIAAALHYAVTKENVKFIDMILELQNVVRNTDIVDEIEMFVRQFSTGVELNEVLKLMEDKSETINRFSQYR